MGSILPDWSRLGQSTRTEKKMFKKILKWFDLVVVIIVDSTGSFVAHEWYADKPFVFRAYLDRMMLKMALQDHSVALANSGLKVTLDMSTYKRPIREILKKIDDMEIDLVAMASHGEGGERRAMEESVTAEVIRHANCPLLVWSFQPPRSRSASRRWSTGSDQSRTNSAWPRAR